MTTSLTLIAADIGNVNTKYRRQGGAWEIAPSLVRMLSGRTGYSFTSDTPLRPLVYLSGPAGAGIAGATRGTCCCSMVSGAVGAYGCAASTCSRRARAAGIFVRPNPIRKCGLGRS